MTHRFIEVRGFKWPRRPQNACVSRLIGEDTYGRWLGVNRGEPWWAMDGSRAGIFIAPIVKLVPRDTFWTVCFQPVEPVVDVDIVLPPRWIGDALEEVDLELDVLRSADGDVQVRDRDEFDRVREIWPMPDDIVAQAEATCKQIQLLLAQHAEPFATVGHAWLARFLAKT